MGFSFVKNLEEVKKYVAGFDSQPSRLLSMDLETTGLEPMWDDIVGISLCYREGDSVYIPIRHLEKTFPNLNEDDVVTVLKPMLERAAVICQNGKFDCEFWRYVGVDVNLQHDTMIMAYLTGEFNTMGDGTRVGLKSLSKEVLGHAMIPIEELFGGDIEAVNMTKIAVEDAYEYACDDANITFRLFNKFYPKFLGTKQEFLYKAEMALIPVVAGMHREGIYVDKECLSSQCESLNVGIDEARGLIYDQIYTLMGNPPTRFLPDLNSPAQVGNLLFSVLGLPCPQKTPTGKPCTKANVLAKLASSYSIVSNILTYRKMVKAKGSFLETLGNWAYPDGKIHCSFLQAHVRSGRFASRDPNMQQIPKKTEYTIIDDNVNSYNVNSDNVNSDNVNSDNVNSDNVNSSDGDSRSVAGAYVVNVRKAFIPAPGKIFFVADYSQIEFKIFMAEAQCHSMLRAIAEGLDAHTQTASTMYGVPYDEVTSEMRRRGKCINFGLLYGEGTSTLAEQIGIMEDEAAELRELYFERMPEVSYYINRIRAEAKRTGGISTRFNRIVTIPELKDDRWGVRAKGERLAVNALIQGTAADILKIAMVRVSKIIEKKYKGFVTLLLTQHDELDFEIDPSVAKPFMKDLRVAMQIAVKGYPTLLIECAVGNNWGELLEVNECNCDSVVSSLSAVSSLVTEGSCSEAGEGEKSSYGKSPLEGKESLAESGEEAVKVTEPSPALLEESEKSQAFQKLVIVPESENELQESDVHKLAGLLKENPGRNIVVVSTTQGKYEINKLPTCLGIEDRVKFMELFPCVVVLDKDSISSGHLLDGVKLV